MNLQLNGKIAFVSGSTAGIGKAIAGQLASEGVEVFVNGRTQARVQETIADISKRVPGARLKGAVCDFSDAAAVRDVLARLPQIDILVNNVGIFEPRPFAEITDEEWLKIIEINVLSGVRLARRILPGMLDRNWGRIVFISSESGVQIPAEMIHYGVTKTAQIGLANGMARLTKGTGVTINSVLPGSTWSEGASEFIEDLAKQEGKSVEKVTEEFFKSVRPSCLLQRFATTDEVAHLVTYLCSPLASATNGAAMRVDGGTIPTIV